MPTYNPKKLGEPEVIREINPTVLCAFLKPFEGYLRTRGLEVNEPSRFDNAGIEKLVDILINPTMKTPQALLNAVFYVEEMSSPLAADSLLTLAQQAGMLFDENGKHTLADVVMQVWLFDSKMVEAQHAWQTWKTPRRMECFQPVQSTGIAPITITEDRLNFAIKDAGDWFAKNNRGRKLFMTPRNDGGFSGGNLDRPAYNQLMKDIEAGEIDCVIVYKVDRLSRSLFDFAQTMRNFDANGVSFVSVTQQFNTTNSMGRLTLNILLSFAQFEREIIGERISDKIAAQRQKGLWCGGQQVLGYDVDRSSTSPKLVVNAQEAEMVREIFGSYLSLQSLLPVVQKLDQLGWTNKTWLTRRGRYKGGRPFDKCSLHALLTNVLYAGKIRHKDQIYDGQHEPIIDQSVFDKVQT